MDRNRFKIGNEHDWLDWLNDEPPSAAAREELRRKRVVEANSYQARSAPSAQFKDNTVPKPAQVTININLSKVKLPKIKKPKVQPKLRGLPHRRLAVALIAIALIGLAGWTLLDRQHSKSADKAAVQALDSGPARSNPSFKPVVPQGKPQLANLASNNTSYDGKRNTYSYLDSLSNLGFTVSEQVLPSAYGSSQQAVAHVADQIGAKQPLTINDGVAFARTDAKSGAQIIVFSLNGLLIFINSSASHSTSVWQNYINSLR